MKASTFVKAAEHALKTNQPNLARLNMARALEIIGEEA